MSAMVAEADSEDLQALFDSVANETRAREPVQAREAKQESETADAIVQPEIKSKPKARGKGKSKAAVKVQANDQGQTRAQERPSESVMSRVGHLTRTLHDALRELGYDRLLEKTAASIPDARDRLAYVAQMTEQAAVRALNATEVAQPIQDRMGSEAENLSLQWQMLFDRQLSLEEFKTLVSGTREFLADVPKQTRATNEQLLEIMMAQDFQDLTGQVIKRITSLAQEMEQQLVSLLVDLVPENVRSELDCGLLNGPVVNAAAGPEVVTSQNQVDDLLASLGF